MGKNEDDEISLLQLYTGQRIIQTQIVNLEKNTSKDIADVKEDLAVKHSENRKSIHTHANQIQSVRDDIWKLKIKIAGYSAIGGALAAVAGHLIDKMFK